MWLESEEGMFINLDAVELIFRDGERVVPHFRAAARSRSRHLGPNRRSARSASTSFRPQGMRRSRGLRASGPLGRHDLANGGLIMPLPYGLGVRDEAR
jgi:hypothetical protein